MSLGRPSENPGYRSGESKGGVNLFGNRILALVRQGFHQRYTTLFSFSQASFRVTCKKHSDLLLRTCENYLESIFGDPDILEAHKLMVLAHPSIQVWESTSVNPSLVHKYPVERFVSSRGSSQRFIDNHILHSPLSHSALLHESVPL